MRTRVACDPIRPPRLSSEAIAIRRENFLSRVISKAPIIRKEEEPPRSALTAMEEKVLKVAANQKGAFLSEISESVDSHPATFKKAIDSLTTKNFIQVHSLIRSRRGGQPKVIEILNGAKPELERLNIPLPKPRLKGGFIHDLYGYYIGNIETDAGGEIEFEKTYGRKTFDLVVYRNGQPVHGYEICLSGTGERNAGQIATALEQEEIQKIVAVFEGKRLLDSTKTALKNMSLERSLFDRVEFRRVGEFVEKILEGGRHGS